MHPRLTTALLSSNLAQRRRLRLLGLFCAALLLIVAPGIATATTQVPLQQAGDNAGGAAVNVGDSSLGQILVDANGMTLYLFDNDEPGKSNCDAGCLRRWPPLLADAGAQPVGGAGVSANLGTIQRDDGTTQVTANDMPLYYWFEDKQPGDVLGQAVGDVWWVLAPDGTAIHTTAAGSDAGQTAGTNDTGATASAGDVSGTETITDSTAATDMTAASADVITNTDAMTDTGTAAAAMDTTTGTGGTGDTSSTADAATTGSAGPSDTSSASDTTSTDSTSGASDTSSAPQQMPVTGADGGTLSALLAVLGVAAGGGWVALRNRKR